MRRPGTAVRWAAGAAAVVALSAGIGSPAWAQTPGVPTTAVPTTTVPTTAVPTTAPPTSLPGATSTTIAGDCTADPSSVIAGTATITARSDEVVTVRPAPDAPATFPATVTVLGKARYLDVGGTYRFQVWAVAAGAWVGQIEPICAGLPLTTLADGSPVDTRLLGDLPDRLPLVAATAGLVLVGAMALLFVVGRLRRALERRRLAPDQGGAHHLPDGASKRLRALGRR